MNFKAYVIFMIGLISINITWIIYLLMKRPSPAISINIVAVLFLLFFLIRRIIDRKNVKLSRNK